MHDDSIQIQTLWRISLNFVRTKTKKYSTLQKKKENRKAIKVRNRQKLRESNIEQRVRSRWVLYIGSLFRYRSRDWLPAVNDAFKVERENRETRRIDTSPAAHRPMGLANERLFAYGGYVSAKLCFSTMEKYGSRRIAIFRRGSWKGFKISRGLTFPSPPEVEGEEEERGGTSPVRNTE